MNSLSLLASTVGYTVIALLLITCLGIAVRKFLSALP